MSKIVGGRSVVLEDPGFEVPLARATASGLRWIALGRLTMDVVAFGVGVVLARLIPPAAFGRAAVALAVILVAADLSANGIAASLVRLPQLERRHREAAMFAAFVGGGALTAAVLLLAPFVSPIFGDDLVFLLRLAAPAFVLSAIGAVAQAGLLRKLAFSRIALVDIASLAIGASSAVVLAAVGVDAAAVVSLYLIATTASATLYLLIGRAARPRWHRAALDELFAFGAPTALAAAAYTVFRHVDYAVLAARMSPTNVGLYWRAHVVAVDYQSRISSVALRIAFPVYSRAESAEHASTFASQLIRLQTLVIAPVVATIVVLAPTAIPILFGERWTGAVAPTQILACAGILAALTAALGPLILASGRPRTLLAFNLGAIAAYAPLVYATAPFGLTVVCSVVVLFHAVVFLSQVLITGRVTGLRVRVLARALAPGAACGGLTLLAEAALLVVLERLDVSKALVLAIIPTAGAAVHVGAVRTFFPRLFGVVRALVSPRPAGLATEPVT